MKLSGLYHDADVTHRQPLSENTHQDPISSQDSRKNSRTPQDPRRAAQIHRQCTSSASNLPSNGNNSIHMRFASELPDQVLQPMYASQNQTTNSQCNFTSLPYQPNYDAYRSIESSYRESRNTDRGYDSNFRHHSHRPRGGKGRYDSRNYFNPNSKYQQPYGRFFPRSYNRRGRGHRLHDFSNRPADLSYQQYMHPNYEQYNPDLRMNNYKDVTQLTTNFNFQAQDYSMAFSQTSITTDPTYVQSDNHNYPTKTQTTPETTKTKEHENAKDNKEHKKQQVSTSPDAISLSYRPSSQKMDLIKKIYDTEVIPLPKEALIDNGSYCGVDTQKYKKTHIRCRSIQKTKGHSSQTINKHKVQKHNENHVPSRSDLKQRKSNQHEDEAVTEARDFSKLDPLLSPLPMTPEPTLNFAVHKTKIHSDSELHHTKKYTPIKNFSTRQSSHIKTCSKSPDQR